AAVIQILNKVRYAAIDVGQVAAHGLEVAGVRVPAVDGQRHTADAGLDQAAGRQELLDALVTVPRARLFLGQVEGLAHGARGDHVESLSRERVEALHGAAGVDVAANVVEAGQ